VSTPDALDVPTPEFDRMSRVITEHLTQEIGEFIAWLDKAGYAICEMEPRAAPLPVWHPVIRGPQQWLAEMHGIDLEKVDAERQLVLQRLRLVNLAHDLENME
jgi:hypothetical protein